MDYPSSSYNNVPIVSVKARRCCALKSVKNVFGRVPASQQDTVLARKHRVKTSMKRKYLTHSEMYM